VAKKYHKTMSYNTVQRIQLTQRHLLPSDIRQDKRNTEDAANCSGTLKIEE